MSHRAPIAAFLLALLLYAATCAVCATEVVVVVSAASPDMQLTQTQVADIFLGRAHRFPDGRRAIPVDRSEGSPLREAFYASYVQRSAAQMKAHWSKLIFTGRSRPPPQIAEDAAAKRMLAENPSAITYLERKAVDHSVRVVSVQ